MISEETIFRYQEQIEELAQKLKELFQENSQMKNQLKDYHYFDTNY